MNLFNHFFGSFFDRSLPSVGVCIIVGTWYVRKYRARAQESGYGVAAKALRKAGVPLPLALVMLLGVSPR